LLYYCELAHVGYRELDTLIAEQERKEGKEVASKREFGS
jgi:hypothetical protein